MTTARTRLVALLGHPVAHSRSPAMMTRAFAALGIDAAYLAMDVVPERFDDAARALVALGAVGANVTVPHKARAAALCDALDPVARAAGAVNTLVVRDGALYGANTDAPAAVAALADAGCDVAGARCVVLGAGGAARAVAAGLVHAGAREVTVAARRIERAEAVARAIANDGGARAVALDAAHPVLAVADVVVQATTAGMHGSGPDALDASRALARLLDHTPPAACAMDLVYAPVGTPFLERARERGMRAVDGLGMLAHQGALAVGQWFGVSVPGGDFRRFLDAVDETR